MPQRHRNNSSARFTSPVTTLNPLRVLPLTVALSLALLGCDHPADGQNHQPPPDAGAADAGSGLDGDGADAGFDGGGNDGGNDGMDTGERPFPMPIYRVGPRGLGDGTIGVTVTATISVPVGTKGVTSFEGWRFDAHSIEGGVPASV